MLTILSAGYPFAAVTPNAVGGAEQVLATLDRALVERGCRSIVVAPQGSTCRGELCASPLPDGPLTPDVQYVGRRAFGDAIAAARDAAAPDVIHLHGTDVAEYLPDPGDTPIVVTLHLWPDRYPPELFAPSRADVQFVCVSEAQRAACPRARACRTIPNGVDLTFFRAEARRRLPRSTVLLLGRICPEKAFHLAMDAAREAELDLAIAGRVFPYEAHEAYFHEEIEPRLGEDARFLGPLDRVSMRDALAAAACVAVPSMVSETSSLAAMEALACGTPVVAFRTPALAELVEDGRTGFLVDTVDEMVEAFRCVPALSRRHCRLAAERRCAAEAMIGGYLELYRTVAGGFPPRAERVAWVR
jgi:glycosyltransferase involved in cell wall biosynthesis